MCVLIIYGLVVSVEVHPAPSYGANGENHCVGCSLSFSFANEYF